MPVNETTEYLKIGFAFGGALLGSIIGTPLIEWFKDRLGAIREWKTQRNEIVGTIRLIVGLLKGFQELRKEAFGVSWKPAEFSQSGFARLANFRFTLFDEHLVKLAALHPEESSKSAVAQRLIQHLVVLKSHFEQLQGLRPVTVRCIPGNVRSLSLSHEDESLLKASDKRFIALERFLCGIYAQRLGINALSLTIDAEIVQFERRMAEHDLAEVQEEFSRRLQQFNAMRAEQQQDA